MRRKSLLAPTLFTFFGVILLLGLGTWQLERLQWKEALIAARRAGMTAPPVAIPTTVAAARALEYRHVHATGHFLPDRTFYLHAMDRDGRPGWHFLAPFALDDGRVLMIDRGFVPEGHRRDAVPVAPGETMVTGILRLPIPPNMFVPSNRPRSNEWFFIDLPAMAREAKIANLLPFYLDADVAPDNGAWPRGGQTRIALPNHHLQYAMTWYLLAAALIIFYIELRRRQRGAET